MKYFLVPEKEFVELLADSMKLQALEKDGVDNWAWYGESFQEVITEYGGTEDDSFVDVANKLKDNYKLTMDWGWTEEDLCKRFLGFGSKDGYKYPAVVDIHA